MESMKYQFKYKFDEFIQYFGIKERDIEYIEHCFAESETDNLYSYTVPYIEKELRRKLTDQEHDMVFEYYFNNITYDGTINGAILDAIENLLEQIGLCFDENQLENIKVIQDDYDSITLTFESNDLTQVVRKGMNAYGEWDFDLHSDEDKKNLIENSHVVLREICHYYEACESKPKVNLNKLNLDIGNYPDTWEIINDLELKEADVTNS